MRRAFLSLYGLIVLSVIAVGWGLDRLWLYYSPTEIVTQSDRDTFTLVEKLLEVTPSADWVQTLSSMGQSLSQEVELIAVDDFAQSKLLQKILSGELVVLYDAKDDKRLYKIIDYSQKESLWIIRLGYKNTHKGNPIVYDLLLMLFYAAIALVVFLWIWPLSKDLSKLEKHTRLVGRDQVPDPLHISHTSTVYDLASAFNRMSQRIRELLASHKEMTYAVSHELRTPLARMKFALEMASASKDPIKMKSQLEGVRADVSEMDGLVNQLLAYASFEQTDQPLNLQSGDIFCLINELIKRLELGEGHKGVSFLFESNSDGFDGWVTCEWHLMERAVINVLQNAHRHAKSIVSIAVQRCNGQVCIIVEDDGPGVPEAERERVFQSFVRLATHINAQTSGFGLGLAIVQRIMGWHQGKAKVTEAALGGARFTLMWPSPSHC